MSWCSGSYMAERIWKNIRPVIKPEDYKLVSKVIFEEFNNADADDWEFLDDDYDNLLFVYLKYNNHQELKEYRDNQEWRD